MTHETQFIATARKQFEFYKMLGTKTFEQLSEKELLSLPEAQSNSIAMIVNHMWGNMKSRWTDFLTTDGEKEWRNRDLEFENVIKTKTELLEKWQEGWATVFEALNSINDENINTPVYIRNQSHSIIEAITRQLGHYAYHVGQIVFLGKMIKGKNWKTLSIPKGASKDFNLKKFSKGKHGGHYSDDLK